MKNRSLVSIIVLLALLYIGYLGTSAFVGYYNQSIDVELSFNKKKDERLVVLDKITKVVRQKLEIAEINDSSYYKNLLAVAFSRQDNMQLSMKWIVENNPNINYGEVSALYQDIMASIQRERAELFAVEKEMQDLNYKYKMLKTQIPSCLFLAFRKDDLGYKPISTDYNKEVNLTGVDNKIKIKE